MTTIAAPVLRKTDAAHARNRVNRTHLFDQLSEAQVLANYRRCFGVGEEIGIDEIRKHATIEGRLTDESRGIFFCA
jgi:hypothetical protein